MTTLSVAGARRGFRDILPVAAFVVPFGLAFGAAAAEKGLSWPYATAMSASVFAGASQFAALEFWASPVAVVPLLLAVFAVNARHVLLGASLFQWLKELPPGRRHATAALISDANWAYALERRVKGDEDAGVLVGSGIAMWLAWVSGTCLGAAFTGSILDPAALAFDTVMVTFFTTVLAGLSKSERTPWPWIVAAATALAGSWLLPAGWHVLAGGIAGGLTGALLHGR